MTRLTRIISTFCFILLIPTGSFAEPNNLSLLKNEVIQYHDSGSYNKELKEKITLARQYIIQQAEGYKRLKSGQKLAIVLDIDETSLSNYNKMVKRQFSGEKSQIHKEILKADSPVIEPMLELYQDAQKHGVHVFFVTGREESERQATKANLLKAGYKKWSGLYLRPKHYTNASIVPFKSQARAHISQNGYLILATIGDQFSDLKGGYAKKGFKLPNPYYYLP